MTTTTRKTLARRWATLLVMGFAVGCGPCGGGDEETEVTVPTSVRPATEIETVDEPDPAAEVAEYHPELPPAREDLPPTHDALPTAENFAPYLVEGDWTTYRGNQARSGLREAPAIREPFIEWSVPVGIQGYANTPIVTADTVYVSSQGETHNTPDNADGVVAVRRSDGSRLWRAPLEDDANGMMLTGNTLLVGTDDRHLVAFDASNGARLWRTEVGCVVHHAPYVDDGWAYLTRQDGYMRVNVETGELDGELEPCRRSERGAISGDGDYMAMSFAYGVSQTFDNGAFLWAGLSPELEMSSFGAWAPPLLTRDMVVQANHLWPFFTDSSDVPSRRPSSVARWRDNGQIAWATDINTIPELAVEDVDRRARHLHNLPWIAGDRMFWTPTTRDELVAVSLVDGTEVGSIAFPDCRRRAFASIVGTPEMGYFPRHDGMLYAFTTDPFAVAWQINLGEHEEAGNLVTHHEWDPARGCTPGPFNGHTLFATPAIADNGTLFVGSGDGYLYKVRDASWPSDQ